MAQNTKSNVVKKTNTTNINKPNIPEKKEESVDIGQLNSIVLQMQKQIEAQAKIIEQYEKEKSSVKTNSVVTNNTIIKKNNVPSNTIKIDGDEDIVVTNNCMDEFVLSTGGFGEGKIYSFNGLGYQREIPYSDLKDAIHNNRSFIESGRIYIEDERVVNKHKLQPYYEHMLKAEDFDKLANMNSKEFFDVLMHLPKAESNTLNRGSEPAQIDLVYNYVIDKLKTDSFPIDLIPQLEVAYSKVKGRKVNIREELDFYKDVTEDKGE